MQKSRPQKTKNNENRRVEKKPNDNPWAALQQSDMPLKKQQSTPSYEEVDEAIVSMESSFQSL